MDSTQNKTNNIKPITKNMESKNLEPLPSNVETDVEAKTEAKAEASVSPTLVIEAVGSEINSHRTKAITEFVKEFNNANVEEAVTHLLTAFQYQGALSLFQSMIAKPEIPDEDQENLPLSAEAEAESSLEVK